MKTKRHSLKFGVALATLLTGSAFAVGTAPIASAAPLPAQTVTPARLADTRVGNPSYTTVDHKYEAMGPRQANSHTEIFIAGRGGVTSDASAVFLNVTDVRPTQDNLLAVYPGPCQTTMPEISNVNSRTNHDTANAVFTKLSASGSVCVYTVYPTNFVIDVTGYVPAGSTPTAVSPSRIAYTLSRNIENMGGRRPAGSFTELQVSGKGNIPVGAEAAILNVTAIRPTKDTFVTLYPGPCKPLQHPDISNVNAPVNADTAGSVFVRLSAIGTVCVYTEQATDLAIDANGFVPAGGSPTSISPLRFAETRNGKYDSTFDAKHFALGRLGDKSHFEIQVTGRGDIPTNATGVVVNLTGVQPLKDNFMTVYPCTATVPNASTVNLSANTDRANSAFVQLSAKGTLCVYTEYNTDFVLDVAGYSTPAK